jgi:hypothetical protein
MFRRDSRGAQGLKRRMARDTDKRATSLETENTGGLLSGFLAEEDVFDRRSLWRLGSWGVASVGAVVLAVYVNQSSIAMRREQVAAADLARQAEQIHLVAKESQGEARRLASAIETLNGDRDRLYSRVTVLEQGLETATGAIAKQQSTAAVSAPPAPTPPVSTAISAASDPPPAQKQPPPQGPVLTPAVSPVATTAPRPADKPVEKSSPVAAAPEPAPATVAALAQKPSHPPATTTPPTAATPPATVTTPAIVTAPAITTMAAITPAPPLVAAKSMMGPPDAAATKLIEPEKPATPEKLENPDKPEKAEKTDKIEKADKAEKTDKPAKVITAAPMPEVVALAAPADEAESDAAKSLPKLPVQRTEFGVDVGSANSVGGLRALWRGLLKSRSNAALTTLRPIIVIREGNNGLGMQLRLVAGPLDDAAAAAKICAGLIENNRPCSTAVFDGQRLIMNADEPAAADMRADDKPAATKPAASRYYVHRRGIAKRVAVEEPAKKPDPPSTLSSFFRRQTPQ